MGGFGVSSATRAALAFAVFLDFRVVSFPADFFFAAFGLGVGVWRRFDFGEALASGVSCGVGDGVASSVWTDFFAFFGALVPARFAAGLGDFFGFGDAAGDSLRSLSLRRLCCSSLTCARMRPVMIAPRASAVASQMRKRTTATERNRARDAINDYSSDLLKKLQRECRSDLPF